MIVVNLTHGALLCSDRSPLSPLFLPAFYFVTFFIASLSLRCDALACITFEFFEHLESIIKQCGKHFFARRHALPRTVVTNSAGHLCCCLSRQRLPYSPLPSPSPWRCFPRRLSHPTPQALGGRPPPSLSQCANQDTVKKPEKAMLFFQIYTPCVSCCFSPFVAH